MKKFWEWLQDKYGKQISTESEWRLLYSRQMLIGYMIEYLRIGGIFIGMAQSGGKSETIVEYYNRLKKAIKGIE